MINVPLHQIFLQSELVSGPVIVGIRPTLPVEGISLILGNDLAGGRVQPDPQVISDVSNVLCLTSADDGLGKTFPACVVTRAAARCAQSQADRHLGDEMSSTAPSTAAETEHSQQLESSSRQPAKHVSTPVEEISNVPVSRGQLIADQESDGEVAQLAQYAISEDEASKHGQCFYWKSGVLMRKWRPRDVPADEEWTVAHQIVMPKKYRGEILSLAHESAMAGYLGVNKTYAKILNHFYWPHLRKDVSEYCKSCHVCQMVGKPNETIPVAPLKPIPICSEPFSEIIIDCVVLCPRLNLEINTYLQSCAGLHVFQRLSLFETLKHTESQNPLSSFSHWLVFLPWFNQTKALILCQMSCSRPLISWGLSSVNQPHIIHNHKEHLNVFTKH